MMTRSKTWEWDQYWDSARLAARDGESGANYEDAVLDAWRRFFEALGDGITLVDIATGNGAVPVVARQVARENNWQWRILGIDNAAIDPPARFEGSDIDISGIEFLGNTPAESLPLEDATADAVTSQYGVEYTDLSRSIPEIARALREGGRVQFVVHASEGGIVQGAKEEVRHTHWLLRRSQLFPATRDFFAAVRSAESRPGASDGGLREQALRAKQVFQREFEAVSQYAADCRNPAMFNYVLETLAAMHRQRASYALDRMLGKVEAMREAVEAHERRLQANIDAAMDRSELDELTRALGEAGIDVECGEGLRDETGARLLGWIVSGRRVG